MPAALDLRGRVFGRWTVIRRMPRPQQRYWLCECSCPLKTRRGVFSSSLMLGHSSSCGCIRLEEDWVGTKTHGLTGTPRYVLWQSMMKRCNTPTCKEYPNYGGRGIKVCKRWLKFENFNRDLPPRPSAQHSLERVNNARGYSAKNVKWATRQEQNRNTRVNIFIRVKGKRMLLIEAAELYGLKYQTVYMRLWRGEGGADLVRPLGSKRNPQK